MYQVRLEAVLVNPNYRRTKVPLGIQDLVARSEMALGDAEKGVQMYLAANYSAVPLGLVMRQAHWMASYGHLDAAAAHLKEGIEYKLDASAYLIIQAEEMLQKIEGARQYE
jgi:hypothetical protein